MGFRSLIFWGSIALNFLLLVVLFFKSALNQMVIDYLRERKEKRSFLISLHTAVDEFVSAIDIIYFCEYLFSLNPGLKSTNEMQRFWQENLKKLERARKHIEESRLKISSLKPLLDELFSVSKVNDVVKNPVCWKDRSQLVEAVAQRVKDAIEKRTSK